MRKFLIAFFCFVTFLGEQQLSAQLFEAGTVIGFNASQIQGDGFRGFRKMGLNAGVAVDINTSEKFSVGLEILYSQKGSRYNRNISLPDAPSEKYAMDYLEVPIIVKYHDTKGMDFGAGIAFARSVRNVYKRDDIDESDSVFGVPNADNHLDINLFGDATYNINELFRMGFRWAFSAPVVQVNDNRIGRHSVISVRFITMFGARSEIRK